MNIVVKSLIICLIFFLSESHTIAQEDGKIQVEQIEPQLMNGHLTVSANFENLFTKKIIGTIQSGLPSIINIEIKIIAPGNKQIYRRVITRSLSYNIWEERYSIIYEDTAEIYSNFDEAKKVSSHLDKINLIPGTQLHANAKYLIQIRVGIIPISSRQSEKVTDWLLDPNQTEENLASDERSGGFKLNLNNLISFFIGGKKHSRFSSDWYSSRTFTIHDLK